MNDHFSSHTEPGEVSVTTVTAGLADYFLDQILLIIFHGLFQGLAAITLSKYSQIS